MDKKTLVVYFSYSGNTRKIAEYIQRKLKCDILEIKPVIPYSEDYQTVVDDEQNSQSSNHIPKIQEINVDINNYDRIIIGTPTWWYRPSPCIRAFILNNDLSNKEIIPFATNAGWLGRTFKEIKELCKNSKVGNEMNIEFSQSDLTTKNSDLEKWIESIGE